LPCVVEAAILLENRGRFVALRERCGGIAQLLAIDVSLWPVFSKRQYSTTAENAAKSEERGNDGETRFVGIAFALGRARWVRQQVPVRGDRAMFFNSSDVIRIDCDAPPYPIVQMCRRLGFRKPEDVRWFHVRPVSRTQRPRAGLFSLRRWMSWIRPTAPDQKSCRCGTPVPAMACCTFVMLSGQEVSLMLTQCSHCHTIHWREV
jgi:hypothetical protein